MKIVILDGYCVNPGDLSWDVLRPFGEVTVYDRTPAAEAASRAAGAEIVLMNKTPLPADVWSRNPDWSFWKSPLMELAGKTMGIVGFGRIGRATGRIADAMGMRVIANDAVEKDAPLYQGFRWAAFEELM